MSATIKGVVIGMMLGSWIAVTAMCIFLAAREDNDWR